MENLQNFGKNVSENPPASPVYMKGKNFQNTKEVLIMQNKLFLKAADVCELLEVSTTSAYEIIANLNSELEKKGYLVLKGKVPTKVFCGTFLRD